MTMSAVVMRPLRQCLEGNFHLAIGRQFWDVSLIRCPTLVLCCGNDFWSRPEDVEVTKDHLVSAERAEAVLLKDTTHFVHLDRPECGRGTFVAAVEAFLKK